MSPNLQFPEILNGKLHFIVQWFLMMKKRSNDIRDHPFSTHTKVTCAHITNLSFGKILCT